MSIDVALCMHVFYYLFKYYTINVPFEHLYEPIYLFVCLLKYYTANVLFKFYVYDCDHFFLSLYNCSKVDNN